MDNGRSFWYQPTLHDYSMLKISKFLPRQLKYGKLRYFLSAKVKYSFLSACCVKYLLLMERRMNFLVFNFMYCKIGWYDFKKVKNPSLDIKIPLLKL